MCLRVFLCGFGGLFFVLFCCCCLLIERCDERSTIDR